jgi:glycosyltransferase involved in cell wall biosynthesis
LKVSVILPAYKEEKTIEEAIRKVDCALKGAGFSYEIIVVDDGSPDSTYLKASQCAISNNHVRVIRHATNIGKGAAFRTGFSCSTGDYVAFIDSDLDISPEPLQAYFRALSSADIAIGSKWHPRSKVKTPFIRRLLSRSFYALAKLLTRVNVSDTQVGLKAFRRGALEKILRVQLVKRYAFDVELLAVASLLNLKTVELPVNMELKAKFSPTDVLRMLVELLGIAYRLRVLRWYQKSLAGVR